LNDGYLFLITSWVIALLVVTHWLDSFWKEAKDLAKIRRRVFVLILMIITLQGIYLPISARISLNLGAIILMGSIFLYFYWRDTSGFRLQMTSVVLFLGIFYAVAYEVFTLDPILMVLPIMYMLPAFMALFILLTTHNLKLQWMMMLGGFISGEVIHKMFTLKHVEMIFVGDAAFRDQLVMGLLIVTLCALFIRVIYKTYQQAIRIIFSQRKQEG
jgi:hypothetical protein